MSITEQFLAQYIREYDFYQEQPDFVLKHAKQSWNKVEYDRLLHTEQNGQSG
jgi:hypothetical protein